MEAVAGGGFGAEGEGVGLERQEIALRPEDLELVDLAAGDVGQEDLPDAGRPRWRIGWRRPSQALKSPTTLTRRALGAQTAKAVPSVPSWLRGCAPSLR
jgi:hypothetical protein